MFENASSTSQSIKINGFLEKKTSYISPYTQKYNLLNDIDKSSKHDSTFDIFWSISFSWYGRICKRKFKEMDSNQLNLSTTFCLLAAFDFRHPLSSFQSIFLEVPAEDVIEAFSAKVWLNSCILITKIFLASNHLTSYFCYQQFLIDVVVEWHCYQWRCKLVVNPWKVNRKSLVL